MFMKKIFFVLICLVATNVASAKTVQITVQPAAAQHSAQVFERGDAISGSNGVFKVEIGLFQEKTLTVKADGFDQETVFISYKNKSDNYEVTLKPNMKRVKVSTDVKTAKIYVDGVPEGGDGLATFNIYKGSMKNIQIIADGYDTYNTSISFNQSPDLSFNVPCRLTANRKDVPITISNDDYAGAEVFVNGISKGILSRAQPVIIQVERGEDAKVLVRKERYYDYAKTLTFDGTEKDIKVDNLEEDESFTGSIGEEDGLMITANKKQTMVVRNQKLTKEQVYAMIGQVLHEYFEDGFEQENYIIGYFRTQWYSKTFSRANKTVRTRVEVRQRPDDGTGLSFVFTLQSEVHPADSKRDDDYKKWNRVVSEFKDLYVDIQSRL